MPRRPRAKPLVISILAWACGFALAETLPQASGGGEPSWPGWSRAALAQGAGGELQPSAWLRLAGPLPYRPAAPDSGWLTETDLTRAVDLIADLGLFFAKLSETDPNLRAREVWAQSQASYGGAAEDLQAAIQEGRFRIVISEGGSLAITRRGAEIWVDSDLAGAWNVERVRQARRNGDDWSDVAGLSGLLFELWRGQATAASDAWLDHQLKSIAAPKAEFEEGGTGAAAVLTRYGFLKDLFLKVSLLRAATENSANAALWRNRAQRIQQQIETLLRSVATTGLSGELATVLRDDWAAYGAQIEQSSSERTWLVLAAAISAAPAWSWASASCACNIASLLRAWFSSAARSSGRWRRRAVSCAALSVPVRAAASCVPTSGASCSATSRAVRASAAVASAAPAWSRASASCACKAASLLRARSSSAVRSPARWRRRAVASAALSVPDRAAANALRASSAARIAASAWRAMVSARLSASSAARAASAARVSSNAI